MVQATCENLILSFVNPHIHQSGILAAPIAKTYPELKYLWVFPGAYPKVTTISSLIQVSSSETPWSSLTLQPIPHDL